MSPIPKIHSDAQIDGVYLWWSNILNCYTVSVYYSQSWCPSQRVVNPERAMIEQVARDTGKRLSLPVFEIEVERAPLFPDPNSH